jgi:hypothetical protein
MTSKIFKYEINFKEQRIVNKVEYSYLNYHYLGMGEDEDEFNKKNYHNPDFGLIYYYMILSGGNNLHMK